MQHLFGSMHSAVCSPLPSATYGPALHGDLQRQRQRAPKHHSTRPCHSSPSSTSQTLGQSNTYSYAGFDDSASLLQAGLPAEQHGAAWAAGHVVGGGGATLWVFAPMQGAAAAHSDVLQQPSEAGLELVACCSEGSEGSEGSVAEHNSPWQLPARAGQERQEAGSTAPAPATASADKASGIPAAASSTVARSRERRHSRAGPLPKLHAALRDLSTWAGTGVGAMRLPTLLAAIAAHADKLSMQDITFLLELSPALHGEALRSKLLGVPSPTTPHLHGPRRLRTDGRVPSDGSRLLTPLSVQWWEAVLTPLLGHLGLWGTIALVEHCVVEGLEPALPARLILEQTLIQQLEAASALTSTPVAGAEQRQQEQRQRRPGHRLATQRRLWRRPLPQRAAAGAYHSTSQQELSSPSACSMEAQAPASTAYSSASDSQAVGWLLRLLISLSKVRHHWRPSHALMSVLLAALRPALAAMSARHLAVCMKALSLLQVAPPLPWQVACIRACLAIVIRSSKAKTRTRGYRVRAKLTASDGSTSSSSSSTAGTADRCSGFSRDEAAAVLQALALFECSSLAGYGPEVVTWQLVRSRTRLCRQLLLRTMAGRWWRDALLLGLPGKRQLKPKRALPGAAGSAAAASRPGTAPTARPKGSDPSHQPATSATSVSRRLRSAAVQERAKAAHSPAASAIPWPNGSTAGAAAPSLALGAPALFRRRTLRYTLWALARFHLPASRSYLHALLHPRHTPHLSPASLVHAFTIVASRHWDPTPRFAAALWRQVGRVWHQFDVPCMADLLWAAARAGMHGPDRAMVQVALQMAGAAVSQRLKVTAELAPPSRCAAEPTAAVAVAAAALGASSTAGALAGSHPPHATPARGVDVHNTAHWRLTNFQPSHLARLLWAVARMGVFLDEEAVYVLLQRGCTAWLHLMSVQEVTAALWALARLEQLRTQRPRHQVQQQQQQQGQSAAPVQQQSVGQQEEAQEQSHHTASEQLQHRHGASRSGVALAAPNAAVATATASATSIHTSSELAAALSSRILQFPIHDPGAVLSLARCAWSAAKLRLPLPVGRWLALLPDEGTTPAVLTPEAAAQLLYAAAAGFVAPPRTFAKRHDNHAAATGSPSARSSRASASSSGGSQPAHAPRLQPLTQGPHRAVLRRRLQPAMQRLFQQEPSHATTPNLAMAGSTGSGACFPITGLEPQAMVDVLWALVHLDLVPEGAPKPMPHMAVPQASRSGQALAPNAGPAGGHEGEQAQHWLLAACRALGGRLRRLPPSCQLHLAVTLAKMRARDTLAAQATFPLAGPERSAKPLGCMYWSASWEVIRPMPLVSPAEAQPAGQVTASTVAQLAGAHPSPIDKEALGRSDGCASGASRPGTPAIGTATSTNTCTHTSAGFAAPEGCSQRPRAAGHGIAPRGAEQEVVALLAAISTHSTGLLKRPVHVPPAGRIATPAPAAASASRMGDRAAVAARAMPRWQRHQAHLQQQQQRQQQQRRLSPACPASLLSAATRACASACARGLLPASDAFSLLWGIYKAGDPGPLRPALPQLSQALQAGYERGQLAPHQVARAVLALAAAWESAAPAAGALPVALAKPFEALSHAGHGSMAAAWDEAHVEAAVHTAMSAVWRPQLGSAASAAAANARVAGRVVSPLSLPAIPALARSLAAVPSPEHDQCLQAMMADELSMVVLALVRLRLPLSPQWLQGFTLLLKHTANIERSRFLHCISKEGLQRILLAAVTTTMSPLSHYQRLAKSATPATTSAHQTFRRVASGHVQPAQLDTAKASPSSINAAPSAHQAPTPLPQPAGGMAGLDLQTLVAWAATQVEALCTDAQAQGMGHGPGGTAAPAAVVDPKVGKGPEARLEGWKVATAADVQRLRLLVRLAVQTQEHRAEQRQMAQAAALAAAAAASVATETSGKVLYVPALAPEPVTLAAPAQAAEGREGNNVLDAAQLLQRVHRQLQQQRTAAEGIGPHQLQQQQEQQQEPSDARAQLLLLDRPQRQQQQQQQQHSQFQPQPPQQQQHSQFQPQPPQQQPVTAGRSMAQALCLRLLSLKFKKMVSFALNVNVMRSAYSSCLPRGGMPAGVVAASGGGRRRDRAWALHGSCEPT